MRDIARAGTQQPDEVVELDHPAAPGRPADLPLTPAEAKFQGLLESAPDAIVIVDTGGRIAIVNSQTERMFGYNRSELIGQPVEILVPERFHTRHERQRTRYVADPRTRPMGAGLPLSARRKDGSEFPAEISLSPLRTEEGLLVTSVIRDITDRQRAAEELERQVQRRTAHLNALLQFSSEFLLERSLDAVLQRASSHAMSLVPEAQRGAIYLYDRQGHRLVLRASTGFNQLPQVSRPVDLGIMGLAFTTRRSQVLNSVAEFEAAMAERPPGEREHVLQALDLQAPPGGMMAIPLIARDQAIGVLLLLRETGSGPFAAEARSTLEALANQTAAAILAEQSRYEAATLSTQVAHLEEQQRKMAEHLTSVEAGMLQAARLAAVGQLAASIAHEINNPLYAARNCLYLLEDDLPAELRDSPYLSMARDQLARIAGIIERMRDFYRPPRGEMAPNDLNRLLEETLALAGLQLRHGAINIIFAPAHDLPPVVCNADQLRQVFLNLVLNAVEAMPDGGTLTVRTETRPTLAIVEIRDTGVGIPDEIRPRLFEPFFTNKPSGTGLGLSISAHIVTQHGGQIEVESSEGEGSTFRIALPYQHQP